MWYFYTNGPGLPPSDVVYQTLGDHCLAKTFCDIEQLKLSGELCVAHGQRRTFFSFYQGMAIFVEECTLGEPIALTLLREGLLSRNQYLDVIRRVTEQFVFNEDKQFCNIAVQLGYLTERQVSTTFRQRIRAKITEAVGWHNYGATWDESEPDVDGAGNFPEKLGPLVYTGVRSSSNEPWLYSYLSGYFHKYVNLYANLEETVERFELDQNEKEFLDSFDGQHSLPSIVKQSNLECLHTWQLVYVLQISKTIEFLNKPKPKSSREVRTEASQVGPTLVLLSGNLDK